MDWGIIPHNLIKRSVHFEVNKMSSDSKSTSNESSNDSGSSAKHFDFDALKSNQLNDFNDESNEPSNLNKSDNSNDSEENPLSQNDAENIPSENNNMEKSDESEPNDEDDPLNSVGRIKMVPIDQLLRKENNKKTTPASVELSSESSDCEPLLTQRSIERHSKKEKSKRRRPQNASSYVEISSSASDTDKSDVISEDNSATESTKQLPDNVYSAKIQLMQLPSNMEPILEQYDLVEIRDADQNVIASRNKSHHTEVYSCHSISLSNFLFSFCLLFRFTADENSQITKRLLSK